MSDDTRSGGGFSWFLAGLGLGSLLGVLYAPKAGQETRDELVANALGTTELARQRSREAARAASEYIDRSKEQVNDYVAKGKDQVNDYVAKGKDQANDYVATSKEHLNTVVSRSKDAVETGRQKINEVYSQGVQAVGEQKEKIAAAYDAGKQAYTETTAAPGTKEELIPGSNS